MSHLDWIALVCFAILALWSLLHVCRRWVGPSTPIRGELGNAGVELFVDAEHLRKFPYTDSNSFL